MSEYIERGALCHKAQAFASDVIFGGCDEMLTGKDSCNPAEWTRGYKKGVADTVGLIMGQPAADVIDRNVFVRMRERFMIKPKQPKAADVVEVKHGRWEFDHVELELYCSVCGHHAPIGMGSYIRHKYCPNCGAKMDGE